MKLVDSLYNIVLAVITNLIAKQVTFSAHEVTKQVRDGISAGLYEIDGLPYETIGGMHTQRVEHEDVRDTVRAAYANGALQGYDSNYNGAYTEYRPVTLSLNGDGITSVPDTNPSSPWTPPAPQTTAPAPAPAGPTYNVSSRNVRHSLHVRPGKQVSLQLPEDLTRAEADRLAAFIKTLPFNQ